jgi:hypothetical protein
VGGGGRGAHDVAPTDAHGKVGAARSVRLKVLRNRRSR